MLVGYSRVSTQDQNLGRQEDLMSRLGVEKVYSEKVSGKNMARPQLQEMLAFLRDGDTLVVESISRLARSTRDLLEIVETLNTKGVKFVSQKESIDTGTPQGRFMLTVFSAMAQLERESILQRQMEGLQSAKLRGVKFGRPPVKKPDNFDKVADKIIAGELSTPEGIRLLGMAKSKFYQYFKEYRATVVNQG